MSLAHVLHIEGNKRNSPARILSAFLLSLIIIVQAVPPQAHASATIAFVAPGGFITGSCSSWASACDLQHALHVAATGYELWAKAGTYYPTSGTDRTVSFVLENGVGIYGGFTGTETKLTQRNPKTHITVLSGEIGGAGASDNSYHVVYSTAVNNTSVLDGFTITAGNANGSFSESWGAGMLSYLGSSPTLSNLIFSGNAALDGGGIFNTNGSNPKLTNVTFKGNSASNEGGGMDNASSSSPTLTNVTFQGNSANQGGGIYDNTSCNPILTNVSFSNNPATDSGGGMYDASNSPTLTNVTFGSNSAVYGGGMFNSAASPTLMNVTFNGNSGTFDGGGIYIDSGSSPTLKNVTFSGNSGAYGGGIFSYNASPTLTDVTFHGNSTTADGGGMFNDTSSPTLTNVTFIGNHADSNGGGMSNTNSSPTLTNATFSGNHAVALGGGIYNTNNSNPVIHNSIFWSDVPEIDNDFSSSATATISDSIVEFGCPHFANCTGVIIDSNPLLGPLANNGGFTQTMALGAGSPAIDAGNNATCASTDQRGVHRPQGSHCDIGAYEARYLTFRSNGSQDGWILESGENTNVGGGSPNSSGLTLTLGDNASRTQYRALLSFSTSSLPDNAIITSVLLKLKRSSVTPPSTDTISLLHGIMLDMKKGFFGSSSALQTSDFQAAGTKTVGAYSPTLSSGFYSINLPASTFTSINKVNTNGGLTQIRLRFKLDDNNNSIANTLNLISGNNATPANRPTLIIVYTTP